MILKITNLTIYYEEIVNTAKTLIEDWKVTLAPELQYKGIAIGNLSPILEDYLYLYIDKIMEYNAGVYRITSTSALSGILKPKIA